jgi:capsid protein
MFKMRRAWLATDFCQPIYEEWLSEAVAKGRIYAPGFFSDPMVRKAYCGAEWNGPSQGQIDPLKEVNAAAKRVQEGFSTRTRETQELTGGDFFRNLSLRVREEKLRREGGLVSEAQSRGGVES